MPTSLRAAIATAPFVAVLLFVACSDQTNPEGVRLPPDALVPDGGKPSIQVTQNPDGTGTKHLCKVAKTGTAGKVFSGTLLLPDGPQDGELMIDDDGIIACADKDCSQTSGYSDATKVACTEVVISPGLINPHDHISFANNPPPAPAPERYEQRHDWRKGLRGHTKLATNAPTVKNAVAAAELRFIMSGLTSTASGGSAGSGAPGLARNIDSNAKQLEGLPITAAVSDTFPLADTAGQQSTTCDGFPAGRKKATDIAPMNAYLPHIAEGVDEDAHAEFLCQSNTYPSFSDADHDLVQPNVAIVHGMAVNPADIEQYRTSRSILIWSPRSNVSLYGNTAPIREYARLGVPITLGTDWLPSGSMNFARELKCADDLNQKYFDKALTDRQLWQAVTINAAYATGTENTIGQLKAGWVADIAMFDASKGSKEYRAVIDAGVEDTILVIRGGQTMYGDSELVSELGDHDCEDLPVCKITKKACVAKDKAAGVTLADLQKAASAVYPLFYCKGETPKNEPTCTPSRGATTSDDKASRYKGISPGDRDGDGIVDVDDNCPSVFNPIRPMDDGAQGDTDGDGIGDACDECPLDDGESCTPPDGDDMDGDGVVNEHDNCPKDPNADQTDADNDGKGAACDACDDRPNPGAQLCPVDVTISQIRDPSAAGHPAAGASHPTVKGVVVTAVKSGGSPAGFFVQDPAVQTFGGIFVVPTTPSFNIAVGNVVTVDGDYVELDGTSELKNASFRVTDPTTNLQIQPIVTDPAAYQANGEATESMLCIVNGPIDVTQQNADATGDFDEFAVGPTNLRVDDFVWDALDNNYPVGTKFDRIVGICGFSHGNRKMWPRSADDIPLTPAP